MFTNIKIYYLQLYTRKCTMNIILHKFKQYQDNVNGTQEVHFHIVFFFFIQPRYCLNTYKV